MLSVSLRLVSPFVLVLFLGFGLLLPSAAQAQVGIGTTTPDPSAQLELQTTTRGFLPPRMTAVEMNAIGTPAPGLVVYNTTANVLYYRDGGTNTWLPIAGAGGDGWGSDVATASGFVTGDGTSGDPLRFINGSAVGHVPTWNGTAWTSAAVPGDNLGNHTATANIQLGANWLSGDGGAEGIAINAAGNVGIGVASPIAPLDINGGATLGTLRLFGSSDDFDVDGGTNGIYAFNNSSAVGGAGFHFKAGGTQLMALKNTGNVGIGTTTPAAQLHTTGTVRFAGAPTTGTFTPATDDMLIVNAAGDVQRYTGTLPSDNLGNHTATQNLAMAGFQVRNTGNIGIGIAAPAAEIDIDGTADRTIRVDRDPLGSGHNLTVMAGGAAVGALTAEGGTLILSSGTSRGLLSNGSSMEFRTSNGGVLGDVVPTTKMTLNPVGNLGVGTAAPAAQLHTTGTVRFAGAPTTGTFIPLTDDLLMVNAAGDVQRYTGTFPGDNLGNHTATTQIQSTAGTAAAPGIAFVGDLDNGLFSDAANEVAIATAGLERLRVGGTGSVGIGTGTSGSIRLNVVHTGTSANTYAISGDASGATTDETYGVRGTTASSNSIGAGVLGTTATAGAGVYALNTNTTGGTAALRAEHTGVTASSTYGIRASTISTGPGAAGILATAPLTGWAVDASGRLRVSDAVQFTGLGTTATLTGYELAAVNTTTGAVERYTGTLPAWGLIGNAGTTPATNFVGTTDAQPLRFRVNNTWAGNLTHTGTTTFGLRAGSNSTAVVTALGRDALATNTTGPGNTAVGDSALTSNTTGTQNTAFGVGSLQSNINTSGNTAIGAKVLNVNVLGNFNTGAGHFALNANTDGSYNTATGHAALLLNTTGDSNTAIGVTALRNNLTGSNNLAVGRSALLNNSSGVNNTAMGHLAGNVNTTGSSNTFIGLLANPNVDNRVNSTAIGANARVDADNAVVIGSVNGINGATADVNVGIGITAPAYPLHVARNYATTNSGETLLTLRRTTSGTAAANIEGNILFELENNAGTVVPSGLVGSWLSTVTPGTEYGGIYFQTRRNGTMVNHVTFSGYGQVGINADPTSDNPNLSMGSVTATAGTESASMTFRGNSVQHAGFSYVPHGTPGSGKLHIAFGGNSNPGNNTPSFTFQNNGNLGIGTAAPAAQLHTTGTVRHAGLATTATLTGYELAAVNTTTGAVERFTGGLPGDNLGNHTATAQIQSTAGTAAAPGYSFTGDLNTGIYSPGADQISIATAATQRFSIDATGNIGVGVAPSTLARLDVAAAGGTTNGIRAENSNTAANTAAIRANNTAATGSTFGVYATTASTAGTGLLGYASAATGTTKGVWGQSDASSGLGVYGHAFSTTGDARGVMGETNSTAGTGVFGLATATTGTTHGLRAESASSGGFGVYGLAYATTGVTRGVYGRVNSTNANAAAIYGENVNAGWAGDFNGRLRVNNTVMFSGLATTATLTGYQVAAVNTTTGAVERYTGTLPGDNLGNHTATAQIQSTVGSAFLPGYSFVGSLTTGIYSPGANEIAFSTNANQRMMINALGNVGIGTATPSAELHVLEPSAGFINTDLTLARVENLRRAASMAVHKVGLEVISTGDWGNSAGTNTGLKVTVDVGVGSANNYAATFMGGNVGIGTTTPAAQLHTTGTVRHAGVADTANQGTYQVLMIDPATGIVRRLNGLLDGYGDNLGNHTAITNLDLSTFQLVGNGGTSGIEIANSGAVGIGTTPSGAERLQISGNINTATMVATNSNTTNNAAGVRGVSTANSGETYGVLGTTSNGTFMSAGVMGTSTASSGYAIGVLGRLSGTVLGSSVFGDNTSNNAGTGVTGRIINGNSSSIGVHGINFGSGVALEGLTEAAVNTERVVGRLSNSNNTSPGPGLGSMLEFAVSNSVFGNMGIAQIGATATNTTSGAETGDISISTGVGGTFTKRMVVRSDGNVGIGTTSPGAQLHTTGSVRFAGIPTTATLTGYEVLARNTATGNVERYTGGFPGDNLGNHIATTNIQLGSNWLSGDGGNEGIRVDANGNVGIGTVTPVHRLDVAASASHAIRGITSDNTNSSAGVYGEATGSTASVYGVYGSVSNSTSNGSAGVYGEYLGTVDGSGVYGYNGSNAALATGVYGYVDGTATNYGVWGLTASNANFATGVYGQATSTTASTYGVMGRTSGTVANATGVYGDADATTGRTYGVRGTNVSTTSFSAGILGQHNASAATAAEVYGVHGKAAANHQYAAGVMGEYTGTGVGSGIIGYNTSASANSAGVYGQQDNTTGAVYGVKGVTVSSNASAAGVYGQASGAGGLAISSFASNGAANAARFETINNTSTTFIIDGRANSTSVFRVRSDGRVGIGAAATAPNYPLDVSGVINASAGFRVNNAVATAGTFLRGNGTNFVPASIQSSDLNAAAWRLDGNSGTTPGTHFIGTTDAVALDFRTSNTQQMRLDASGNLGIGISTPVSRLTVSSVNSIGHNNSNVVSFARTNDGGSAVAGYAMQSVTGDFIPGHWATGLLGAFEQTPLHTSGNQSDIGVMGLANSLGLNPWGGVFASASGTLGNGQLDLTTATRYVGLASNQYAGVFMGGNVGFGTTAPEANVDVLIRMDDQPQVNFTGGAFPYGGEVPGLVISQGHSGDASAGYGYVSGLIDFRANDFGGFNNEASLAQIISTVDPNGGGSWSGGLMFATSPGGAIDPAGRRTTGAAPQFRMMLDHNGNLGIGTQNPAQLLHVADTRTANGSAAIFANAQGATGDVYGLLARTASTSTAASAILANNTGGVASSRIFTGQNNGANRAILTNFGMLGLGNSLGTSPAYHLHIAHATSGADGVSAPVILLDNQRNVVNHTPGKLAFRTDAVCAHIEFGKDAGTGANPGLAFDSYSNASSSSVGNGTGTNRMFISATNQAVGIGTTAPGVDLEVADDNYAEGHFLAHNNTNFVSGALVLGHARGTRAAPTTTQNGDVLGVMQFRGYVAGTGWMGAASQIRADATQNWTGAATGSALIFSTVANGTTTSTANMHLAGNGFLGLGPFFAPTYPLDINLMSGPASAAGRYFASAGNIAAGIAGAVNNISVRALGAFWSQNGAGGGFICSSDERIKHILAVSDGRSDLERLMQIEVTDYAFRDTIGNQGAVVKGLIAQQLERVYPEAVTRQTNIIPNIYQAATALEANPEARTLTVTLPAAPDLTPGDRVRLITPTNENVMVMVSAVNGNTFTVQGWQETNATQVFVYGKEVNDFRVVDYDRVHTLGISAIQELARRNQTLQEDHARLQQQVSAMAAQQEQQAHVNQTTEQRIQALEAMLARQAGR